MALGDQFQYINNRVIDSRGLAVGSQVYFYLTGTTTLATVYANSDLTTPIANPYTVNAGAAIPNIYLDPAVVYRVRIVGSTGQIIDDLDPYDPLTGASLTFIQAGTGAVSRSVQDKAREQISAIDFGALPGLGDVRLALQKAIDYASSISTGEPVDVLLPPGTYSITPTAIAPGFPATHEFGATLKYAFLMKSNVRLVGHGAKIWVTSGVSSRATPQNFAIAYSEAALTGVGFDGIMWDLNATNNYFSPSPSNTALPQEDKAGIPGRYLRYHHAAIFFEGAAGKGSDVTIESCTFQNQAGVSVIIAGRLGTAGVGRRWRILNCNFLELGLDAYDHSSIFLWCDDALIEGCFWRNELIYAPTLASLAGVNSAVEIHGSNTICDKNVVDGANRGFFVTENGYGRVEAVKCRGNILRRIKYCGIDIAFDGSGGMGSPRLIEVADNIIDMSNDDTNLADETVPTGVQYFGLDSVVAPIESLVIARNEMKRPASTSGRACQGIGISLQAAGFGMIDVIDNGATGFTRGGYVVTSSSTTCETLNFSRNRWRNPNGGTQAAPYGTSKIGVFMLLQGGLIQRLTFDDRITDTRAPVSCTFTDAGDLVTATAHGLVNDETLIFDDVTTTTGLTIGRTYFVINKTTNTFQVSLTKAGSAVALTTNGTGIYKANKWAFGIAAQVSGAPVIREFLVARSAQFDRAMPIDVQVERGNIAVTFTDAGDLVTSAGHGLNNGERVTLESLTSTSGITVGTTYFVINKTTDTFQLSATSGGSAIALTTNGSGILAKLIVSRLLGVAVTGTYPDTSYVTLAGGSILAGLVGVRSTDELAFSMTDASNSETSVTHLIDGFVMFPMRSATNTVALVIRNVTASTQFTSPGFTFRITAYPGR